jgi:hypothetical protein
MELPPNKIIFHDTNQVLVDLRKLKKPLCHIWSQWNKTRTQQQKEQQKIFKHLETEEHIVE